MGWLRRVGPCMLVAGFVHGWLLVAGAVLIIRHASRGRRPKVRLAHEHTRAVHGRAVLQEQLVVATGERTLRLTLLRRVTRAGSLQYISQLLRIT